MSALGQKQTSTHMEPAKSDVCFVPKADSCSAANECRYSITSAASTAAADRILDPSSWRSERLALLYDIGGRELRLLVAVLNASMGRFSGHLVRIARLQRAGWLALYGEIETAFNNITGFDSRMRVPSNQNSRIYFTFNNYRHITRNWTVCLRQNFSRNARRCCGRRALRRCVSRNESGSCADRAGSKTCKASSCQHGNLPAAPGSLAFGLR